MTTHKSQNQEGIGLEYLDKLTFFDTIFEYRNRRYEYEHIQHIEFTAVATKHRVNFVPAGTSYDASLILHLKGNHRLQIKQESAFLRGKEKQRSEAVMRAATIFMNVTFDRRIGAYERQLEEKGFVSWGKYQISRNGDLFKKNELRMNVLDDDISFSLGPFHVECRKTKPGIVEKLKELWSGATEVIDISIDRDCFIFIMKYYLGISWHGERVPQKQRAGTEIFKEALLILGGALCKADGRISPEEIARFKQYFQIDEDRFPGAGKIFTETAKSSVDIRKTANRIYDLLDGKRESLEYILIGLMQIAAADGNIDAKENEFIYTVSEEFSFSGEQIRRLFLIFEKTRQHSDSEESNDNLHVRHLEVLGLRADATWVEIKAAYRHLARQHHPDLLRSRGVPIDDIENAEEVLKVINSAYEWLTRHHEKTQREY